MSTFRSVLVADDEPSIRHVLTLVLADKGYEVRAVADGDEALRELAARPYDSPEAALEAVALGAYDYVPKPFKPEEMVLVLRKAEERLRLVRENKRLRQRNQGAPSLDRILGDSETIRELRRQIQKLAPVTTTVLISGESGTGKELVARALHELSPRAP